MPLYFFYIHDGGMEPDDDAVVLSGPEVART
jgi:hypothetical protein